MLRKKVAPVGRIYYNPLCMLKYLKLKRIIGSIILSVVLLIANGCDRFYGNSESLKLTLGSRKKIRVATLRGPFTYQKTSAGTQGLEADLLRNFADSADLDLEWQVFSNHSDALKSVSEGFSDIAALHRSGTMRSSLWAGPTYQDADLVLVCPQQNDQNTPKFVVLAEPHVSGRSRYELLSKSWKIVATSQLPLNQLFKASLKSKESFCIATESDEANSELRYFPSLKIFDKLETTQSLRFWVNRSDPKLLQALFYWNQKISQDRTLARIRGQYQRPIMTLTSADLNLLFDSLDDEFKTFGVLFKEAAAEHRLPWQLVAAVSFQESHWNFEARSYTGVRGLMQLTEDTAKHMGISDRRDPEQNVWGGSKYLRFLFRSQPSHLSYRERLTLTLASYNVGLGHLRDAQKLAVQFGKNPFSWKDLREILPLLADKSWSQDLRFGPARGQEAVDFAERTLAYYDVLTNLKK
jgi:membrane-bound lytic murein transglycosylase F